MLFMKVLLMVFSKPWLQEYVTFCFVYFVYFVLGVIYESFTDGIFKTLGAGVRDK